ncbi:MAG: peptide ABC transporter substrate-binding protein, partial [Coriobacteriia bacterium]|nr:peptide ABC transporter substrate-binding protein [Coriobacteriia bacterium]
MQKKLLGLILSAVMILALAACGGNAPNGDASDQAASGGENGSKVLTAMLSTNVMSLDTSLATDGESFEVIGDLVDGLTQFDQDGKAVPALAESYDVSEDGKNYT